MRGKAGPAAAPCPALRITPAYAGKSYRSAAQQRAGRDHPRVCGEKSYHFLERSVGQGSPPRMRGKAAAARAGLVAVGITPAYAGKSRSGRSGTASPRDHPRVCGEKIKPECPDPCISGSPPRMRGKVNCQARRLHSSGITPAYAGKSTTLKVHTQASRDHPRVCGEKESRANV